LFDVMGTEINWLSDGELVPEAVGVATDTLTLTVASWWGSAVPILGTSTLATRVNLRSVFLPLTMKQS
jgi:hypothetical protein